VRDKKRHDRPEDNRPTKNPIVDLTVSERSLRARLAVHASWARTPDRSARTAPARKAARDRFEREVDPDGTLDSSERARRAHHAMHAHMTRMALRSVQARRKGAIS
jgi:hypothetical protein